MCSYLTQNNFYENSGCGLKIINYNYRIIADTNSFRENCEHGIYIDLDSNTSSINVSSSTPNATRIEKIKQFKNISDFFITYSVKQKSLLVRFNIS